MSSLRTSERRLQSERRNADGRRCWGATALLLLNRQGRSRRARRAGAADRSTRSRRAPELNLGMNTANPVAFWALIARGTAYSNYFPFIPSSGGLPHPDARSASTLVVSRPAQRSRRLRPACSLHRLSDTFVSKAPTVSSLPPPLRKLPAGAIQLPGGSYTH